MDTAKHEAWSAYLATVKIRFVPGGSCSSCEGMRIKFEKFYEGERQAARLATRKPRPERLTRKVASIVLAMVGLCATAHAATYYVAPGGDNNRSCTAAGALSTPKQTISDAMRCLGPGDTLMVRGGTYAEEIRNPPAGSSWNAPTTIKAYTGEAVIIQPSGTEYNVKYGAGTGYSILDGLHLDTTYVRTGTVVRITEGAHHIRIANCEIYSTNQRDAQGILSDGTGHEFLGNEIHHVSVSHFVHGIYHSGDNALIQGNHIYDVQGYGVHIFNGTDGVSAHHNRVIGNKVHDTGFSPDGVAQTAILLSSGAGNQAIGNEVYNNHRGIEVAYGGTDALVSCNESYNNHGGGGWGIGVSAGGAVVRDNRSHGNDQDYVGTTNAVSGETCAALTVPPGGGGVPTKLPVPTNLRAIAVP